MPEFILDPDDKVFYTKDRKWAVIQRETSDKSLLLYMLDDGENGVYVYLFTVNCDGWDKINAGIQLYNCLTTTETNSGTL